MYQHDSDRLVEIKIQARYNSRREVKILYQDILERNIHVPYVDIELSNRIIVLKTQVIFSPEDYRFIFAPHYLYTKQTKRNILLKPSSYYTDKRYCSTLPGSLIQLQNTQIQMPITHAVSIPVYVENYLLDQRSVELKSISYWYNHHYVYLQRYIRKQLSESGVLLPLSSIGEVTIYINTTDNYADVRLCKFSFTKDDWRYIYQEINRYRGINTTTTTLGIIGYNDVGVYVEVPQYYDNRLLHAQNKTYILERKMVLSPYNIYDNTQDMYIDVRRGISINEDKVFWTIWKWDDRYIYMPSILYCSERNCFVNSNLIFKTNTLQPRHPLDIIVSRTDIDRLISNFTPEQIESIIIFNGYTNEIITYLTQEDLLDPSRRVYRLKMDKLFEDKQFTRVKLEIFTVTGVQYTGNTQERKQYHRGVVLGHVIT